MKRNFQKLLLCNSIQWHNGLNLFLKEYLTFFIFQLCHLSGEYEPPILSARNLFLYYLGNILFINLRVKL